MSHNPLDFKLFCDYNKTMSKEIKLLLGDSLIKLKELEDSSVDSIVTDPPYELGFMGKSWDSTGIANNVELWKECLRVLKPGGHLLAFSGTRTYHRMASAIEDAGFEVRDMIEWVYGSGFPKSHNIGLRLDQKLGLQGFRGKETSFSAKVIQQKYKDGRDKVLENGKAVEKYEGKSEIAKQYQGWGTALKPAHEPICMARKPLAEKTVAENCLKWGTGGINIDESRVESTEFSKDIGTKRPQSDDYVFKSFDENTRPSGSGASSNLGRFPANLIHDNSEEVRECFPNESERFFKSIIYQAKASKSERNKGCEELEEKPKVFNGQSDKPSTDMKDVEKRFTTLPKANNHPTVKPVALMEYLIKMVTPKGGIVLDPFMGSGSTGVAAKQNDYGFIGIDMTPEYIEIAKARIDSAGLL